MADGFAYIGIQPCGCVTAACVDEPEYKTETAKSVRDWISRGMTVERVTNDVVRQRLRGCKCDGRVGLFPKSDG